MDQHEARLVTPGETFAGIMPAFNPKVFQPGSVGVISRSGSLGTLLCLNIVQAGLGVIDPVVVEVTVAGETQRIWRLSERQQ